MPRILRDILIAIFGAIVVAIATYIWTLYTINRDVQAFLQQAQVLIRQERYDEVREMSANLRQPVRNHKNVEFAVVEAQVFKSASAFEHDIFGLLDRAQVQKLKNKAEFLDGERDSAQTKALVGLIESLLDNPGQAVTRFREAADRDPNYANVYNFWGYTITLWRRPGDQETWAVAAENNFNKALKLAPRYERPLINLGVLAVARVDKPSEAEYQSAYKYFQQAESIAPRNPDALLNSGACLVTLGLFSADRDPARATEYFGKASEKFKKAYELGLDSALLHNNWGYLFQVTGDARQAMDHYNRALQLQPISLRACGNRADLQKQSGDQKQAILSYGECLELEKELATHLVSRAADAPDSSAANRLRSMAAGLEQDIKDLDKKIHQLGGRGSKR